ncbi:hypothetical protein HH299_08970, partial [Xanthomonas sp. Kuri4-2]
MRLCLRAALCCVLTLSTAQAGVPLTPAGNGHLVVPTFVDGKGTLPFILDTGADGTGIYDWFARQQALRPGPVRELGGMTGTTSTPTYRLRSVGIDGRFLHDLVVDSYPDRHDQEIAAGVVGNDLMDGSVAVFDFPCAQLSLLPKPVDLRRLLTRAAQRFEGGAVAQGTQLTFPVRIGEAEGIAVLDTGSRDTKINTRFARAAGIDPAAAAFAPADAVYGASAHAMDSRQGPIGRVRFGALEVRDARARVMDLPVFEAFGLGDRPAMIFGLDLMRDHRLVYDHQARRFWFDRST